MKPTLVLMPGMDGTGTLFAPLKAVLGEWPTVTIAYPADTPASYKQLLAAVRDRLPPEAPYALVAESFSGPLAVMLAATCPPGLCALVLCASFVRSPLGPLSSTLLPAVPQTLFRWTPPAFAIAAFLVGSGAPRSLIADVQRAIAMVEPSVLHQRLRALDAVDVTALGRRIAVPVLYLQARHDRLVHRRAFEDVRAAIPQLTPRMLRGPHLLLQRRPEATAEAIIRFITSATTP